MIVLGIESSCDETAAAVVRQVDDKREILAEEVLSQLDEHRPFGGIVPEIAARSHLDHLDTLIARVMAKADIAYHDLSGVAATGGPGLIGGVLVGVMTAKAIAAVADIPFLAINHLEGHALSARLHEDVEFPYLLLLVSGGHCQLLIVEGVNNYSRLGTTIDDAIGEAFDKTAKILGLPYPGGPALEQAAVTGDEKRFDLPRPMKGRAGCHFSFSGLKTAVRHVIDGLIDDRPDSKLNHQDVADVSASFQAAAGDVLVDRTAHAIQTFHERYPNGSALVIAGGVAANTHIRERLAGLTQSVGMRLIAPPQKLCTDNATMIAWAGIERLRAGLTDSLDFAPRPRWPLDPDAPPVAYAGVKA
ncbi:MAG: tRNA (adenosine(37)-N6)-threonylcarbamoyltransferase complex transferase subunit TsaD [Rhodospirillales bacterium]|jgi:N6-L-threonylcarbamoyladenine synthase